MAHIFFQQTMVRKTIGGYWAVSTMHDGYEDCVSAMHMCPCGACTVRCLMSPFRDSISRPLAALGGQIMFSPSL